ncbi:ABC transporter ATP-binding protein [Tianweitania sediminis]|uniref:ABC transporter ATP-binding protein n=1 Tax=Tianweitania sediminis TaxID=1502156 RepID=A0A8J7R114_9HYPH|nr:ABC transporter ATP-binding protein [Tianweitania sediminis]MBP0440090.1 ABC transporter ATP-binding protein [Tianweitania sediminis]
MSERPTRTSWDKQEALARPVGLSKGGREAPVLVCADIERRFGGLRALKGVSLSVEKGEIFGLVGPNGSGKTTMVNVMTGFYPPSSGTVTLFGQDVSGIAPHRIASLGVARTFQNLALFKGMSVLDNIMLGRHTAMRPSALGTFFYWWWSQREELAHRRVVEETIEFMQLEDIRNEPVEVIPIGLQKRVELARALVAEPRFLILDEPMAGMNQEEKEYIARFILDAREERNTTILIIEHHMDVVTAICDRVVVLSYGEIIAEGEPRAAIADPAVVKAYIGERAARRQAGAAA